MEDALPFETGPDGPHCSHCGYLLRGVRSAVCVECGRERHRRIAYFDRMEFDAVRAALDLAGVPHEYHDPQVGIIGMLTLLDGVNLRPVIMIKWPDLPHAEAALEEVGLAIPVALVDEGEPFCPCCGFVLSPRGEGHCRCKVCGTRCAWYESFGEDDEEPDRRSLYGDDEFDQGF